MKNRLFFIPIIVIFIISVLTFIVCDKNGSTGPSLECSNPDAGAAIKVNNPEEGETFNVGEKIDILYSIDVVKAPGAVAFISKDNGKTWENIIDGNSIPTTKDKGYECIIYSWIIPSDFVTEPNSNIRIKVTKYGDPMEKSVSDAFTIEP